MGLMITGWGNLGQDVEIQYASSGFAFGKTSIACKIPKKNPDWGKGQIHKVPPLLVGQ